MTLGYKLVAGMALILVMFVAGFHGGKTWSDNEWQAETDRNTAAAAVMLHHATTRVIAQERGMAEAKDKQEIIDAKNKTIVAGLERSLRAGRLRDPGAVACGSGTGGAIATSAGDSGVDGAVTGGVLSEELGGFLVDQAVIADEINIAYLSCRADSMSIREVSRPE